MKKRKIRNIVIIISIIVASILTWHVVSFLTIRYFEKREKNLEDVALTSPKRYYYWKDDQGYHEALFVTNSDHIDSLALYYDRVCTQMGYNNDRG